jgi:hypothetical protein
MSADSPEVQSTPVPVEYQQYSPSQEVSILRRTAVATYAIGGLAVIGLNIAGVAAALPAHSLSPAEIATVQAKVDAYVDTQLNGDCQKLVRVTLAKGITPMNNNSEEHAGLVTACGGYAGLEIAQKNIEELRAPIDESERPNWPFAIGVGVGNAAIIGLGFVFRKKLVPTQLPTVQFVAKKLHDRHDSVAAKEARWREANQQWLPLTSDARDLR